MRSSLPLPASLRRKVSKVKALLQGLFRSGSKGLAWLIDPEKEFSIQDFGFIEHSALDLILIGGSTADPVRLEGLIKSIRSQCRQIPICLFPGSCHQICAEADAILFLSLISGRNPEFLIGQQVKAAEEVSGSGLEVLPTAYLLVNDGEILAVHSVSQTMPLINSQLDLIASTALAGKLLGMSYFFLDAGSGASLPVRPEVIRTVKDKVKCPVIVGGGIDSSEKVKVAFESGADLVVIGNGAENNPGFLAEVLNLKQWYNHSLNIN